MDEDRKYRQRGYMDSDRRPSPSDRPRPQGPRQPFDTSGPRLPRLVQSVTASRCYNCATALPNADNLPALCPKCSVALHVCKQCAHFEPSTRFQCLRPVLVRIARKDEANDCDQFKARVTVARDAAPVVSSALPVTRGAVVPRNATDARAAFDSLFKK